MCICVGVYANLRLAQNDKLMRSFQLLCFERLDHHSDSAFELIRKCEERKKNKILIKKKKKCLNVSKLKNCCRLTQEKKISQTQTMMQYNVGGNVHE